MAPECCGSITTERPPPLGGGVGTDHDRRRLLADRIQQFRAGQEDDACAGQRQQDAAGARIGFHVMTPAFDRPDGNGVGDQPRFGAGLDGEQAGDALQHGNC